MNKICLPIRPEPGALLNLEPRRHTQRKLFLMLLPDLFPSLHTKRQLQHLQEEIHFINLQHPYSSTVINGGVLIKSHRLVFHLRDVKRLTNHKVAKVLGLSLTAVKARIHRARLFLRDRLSDYFMNGENKFYPFPINIHPIK